MRLPMIHGDFWRDNLNELYVSRALRCFGINLILLFIPIYLLKLGYSLPQVLLFYVITFAVLSLCVVPAAKLVSKIGIKHTMNLNLPILLLFFGLLYWHPFSWATLIVLALLEGIQSALYWISYHVDFSKFSQSGKRGSEVSLMEMIVNFCQVAGPLIGGIIITAFGFEILLLVVTFFLVLSSIPLILSPDTKEEFSFKFNWQFNIKQASWKTWLTFFIRGIETASAAVVWPLFVYLYIIKDLTSLGLITTLSFFATIVLLRVVGQASDSHKGHVLQWGAGLSFLGWIGKSIASNALQVFGINTFASFAQELFTVPFEAKMYDRCSQNKVINFIVKRELMVHLGKMSLFVVLLFLPSLNLVFPIVAVLSLVYLIV